MGMRNIQKSGKWRKTNLKGFPPSGGRKEETTRDSLGQGSDEEAQASGDGMTNSQGGLQHPLLLDEETEAEVFRVQIHVSFGNNELAEEPATLRHRHMCRVQCGVVSEPQHF